MLTSYLAIFLLCGALTGCSDEPVAPQDEPPTTTATATISPAGGVLTLGTESGHRVDATFPAGAVLEATRFEIEVVDPDPGEWVRFRVSPAGFLRAPIAIALQMPAGWTPSGKPGLSLGGSALPTEYNPTTRTLTASTHYFGYAGNPPLSSAKATPAAGNNLVASDLDCVATVASINNKIGQIVGSNSPVELISQIIDEYNTLLLTCPEQAPSVQQITTALQNAACNEYDAALVDLSDSAPITDATAIQEKANRLTAAQGLKLEVAATCGTAEDYINAVKPLFLAYVQDKNAQYGDENYIMQFDTWDHLWQEVLSVFEVQAQAGAFGLDDMFLLIQNEVLVPLMDLFRDKAYRMCFGVSGTQAFLGDLYTAGALMDHKFGDTLPAFLSFSADDLERDIQYCASSLDVNTYDGNGTLLETVILDQDLIDYSIENQVVVAVPSDGTVELVGLIRALGCFDVPPYPDVLEIRADGFVVDTFGPTNGVLLDENPYTVDVGEMLTALNLDGGDSFTIRVRRKGACADFLGMPSNFDIFSIEVDTAPASDGIDVVDHDISVTCDLEGGLENLQTEEQFVIDLEDEQRATGLEMLTLSCANDTSITNAAGHVAADASVVLSSLLNVEPSPFPDRASFLGYTVTVSGLSAHGEASNGSANNSNSGGRGGVYVTGRLTLLRGGAPDIAIAQVDTLPPVTITIGFTTSKSVNGDDRSSATTQLTVSAGTQSFFADASESKTLVVADGGASLEVTWWLRVIADAELGVDDEPSSVTATAGLKIDVSVEE